MPNKERRTTAAGRLPRTPEALYACCEEGCREERSWPADDVQWFDGQEEKRDDDGNVEVFAAKTGWYCSECASEIGIEPDGPRIDEVLALEGRESGRLEGEPDCADCAFYSENARTAADSERRELLLVTHGIAEGKCCHPTSLVELSNGDFQSAKGMRAGWCGRGGLLFATWPQRQLGTPVEATVRAMDKPTAGGNVRKIRVTVELVHTVEIETSVSETTVRRLGLEVGTRYRTTAAHDARGELRLNDWKLLLAS